MKSTLDLSGIKKLESKLNKLKTKEVDFGYFQSTGTHSTAKMPYASLAWILEEGTRSNEGGYAIPPRPALKDLASKLRTSHTEFETEMTPFYKTFLENESQSEISLVRNAAEHLKGRYQYNMEFWYIEGSKNTRNAPLTLALKGHNRPYEDTGELIANADYRIT